MRVNRETRISEFPFCFTKKQDRESKLLYNLNRKVTDWLHKTHVSGGQLDYEETFNNTT